jgi:hypothetical protein
MDFLSLLPKLLIAGGSSFLGTLEIPPTQVINNHTLAGEKIPSTQVVCRDRWGTPMLPNGKAGYSLISPINQDLIAQSLWVPPVHGERPAKKNAPVTPVVAPVSPAKPGDSTVPAPASTALPAN